MLRRIVGAKTVKLTSKITVPRLFIATVTASTPLIRHREHDIMILTCVDRVAEAHRTLDTCVIERAFMTPEDRLTFAEHMPTGHSAAVF